MVRDPSRPKIIDSHPDFYVAQVDGQAPFKIAKKGLSGAMLKKIDALHAQHLADGGYADSSDATGGSSTADPGVAQQAATDAQAANAAAQGADLKASEAAAARDAAAKKARELEFPDPKNPGRGRSPIDIARESSEKAKAENEKNFPSAVPPTIAGPSQGVDPMTGEEIPGDPVPNPAYHPPGPATPAQPPPKLSSALQTPPASSPLTTPSAAAAVAASPRVGAGPNYGTQLDAAIAQQKDAASQAQSEQDKLNASQRQTMMEAEAGRARLQADLEKKLADNDALRKPLEDAVVNGKIDPQRLWSNSSVPAKVGAYIGIMLGGISQGLFRGGPNQAVESINGMISRDIDAQKANLEHKANLLNYYRQRGLDIEHASQQAELSQRQHVINMMRLADLQAAPGLGKANLQATIAGLTQQQIKSKMELAKDMQAREIGALDIQAKKQQLAQSADATGFRNAIFQAMTPGADGTARGLPANLVNHPAFAAAGMKPEEYAPGPDGKYYHAGSKENADLVKQKVATLQPALKQIDDLSDAQEKLSTLQKVGGPRFSAAAANVESRKTMLQAQLGALLSAGKSGTVRMSKTTMEAAEKIVGGGPALFENPTALKAKLDAFRDSLQGELDGTYQAYLPTAPRPKSEADIKKAAQ